VGAEKKSRKIGKGFTFSFFFFHFSSQGPTGDYESIVKGLREEILKMKAGGDSSNEDVDGDDAG
jgi:hypothetical protein